ncbi:MAG: beta-galactosidase, partial [Opitutaceae bacterium]|nr:beta-galactosidase [Opitutaceae bacterium]
MTPILRPLALRLCAGGVIALNVIAAIAAAPSSDIRSVSLNGEWKFAADHQKWGDRAEWFSTTLADGVWDTVTVPHTWSHDPRFIGYTGPAWYRHTFTSPPVAKGEHVRLAFGAVFRRARVWLNGELLGSHELGYTPFEFDVTGKLKPGQSNLVVVCADNSVAKTFGVAPYYQGDPWWDDGGIIRDVTLLIGPNVYVARQKVEALPDLATGTAEVRIKAWVRNTTEKPIVVRVSADIARENDWLTLPPAEGDVSVSAGATTVVELRQTLGKDQVSLWQLDAPVLYQLRTSIDGHARDTVRFGLRRFETRGSELLLNGQPVRLAGANRHASYPGGGQDEPSEIVERDMQLMKAAGFVFQRLSHYALAPAILDWADRHGMLLIAENAAVYLADKGIETPERQAIFREQHREMIERDWNHPSVVAWSVGNEMAADTPAGVNWVKIMRAHTLGLDPTRLVVIVSNTVQKPNLKPEEEGSFYGDFVCLNTYGATPQQNAANIDRVRALYPNKPMIVTEYGLRRNWVESEIERVDWFREMLGIIRARPFISAASVWSFNDYRSRHVGTS